MQAILLTVMVFGFALVKSSTHLVNDDNVVIFRGDKDRFTSKIACSASKANCSDENCTYCQCKEGQTFVLTRSYYGECVSNELLVYATSDEAYFRVENYPYQRCLYYGDSNRVDFVRQGTCGYDGKYYWIWTNHGQLLNRESLQCMTDDHVTKNGTHFIVMRKCDKSNWKQKWRCESGQQGNYIKQRQFDRYLYYGEHYNYVTTRNIHWSVAPKWRRFDSTPTQDVCSKAVGCETFKDGSSIIILNKTKCEENSGGKEIHLWKTGCSLLTNLFQYLQYDTWKPLEMKNGSLEIAVSNINSQVSLKWNLKKTPKSWGGLLVKVQFKCEDITGSNIAVTEHCVVVKYTGTFKGFHNDDDDDCDGSGDDDDEDSDGDDKDGQGNSDGDDKDGEGDSDGDNNGNGGTDGQTDKDKTNVNQESNSGDKDNTQTIIIIVCVLLALILAGVVGFIVYRYRNRLFHSGKENTEQQDEADKDGYANTMNPLYPVNNNESGQRECELYESATDHVYQSVDTDHKTPQNHTYDYAVVDGPLAPQDKEDPTTTQLPHKYHVLEGP